MQLHDRPEWTFAVGEGYLLPGVPMVRRLVTDLLASGIEEIVCVVGHRAEAVRGCLADLAGVRFVERRQPKGTADATLLGLEHISGSAVVICYADIVTTAENISRLMDEFKASDAEGSLLVSRSLPSSTRWMAVETNSDGRVVGVVPAWDGRAPRFAGIAVLNPTTLKPYLLRNPGVMSHAPAGSMPPIEADLSYSLDLMAQENRELTAVLAREFVVDVDKPWQIVEANVCALNHTVNRLKESVIEEGAIVDDSADISTDAHVYLRKGARIGKRCRIDGSVVLDQGASLVNGAILGGRNFVGRNRVCEDYCIIKRNSVIGPSCYFGHASGLEGIAFEKVSVRRAAQLCAVLGSHVNIAGGVMTGNWRFDDGVTTHLVQSHREKPERFGEMTFLGDFVRVGNNVVFAPGAKVGSYSCIGPLIYVERDVPDRSLILKKDTVERKEWGPERYGW